MTRLLLLLEYPRKEVVQTIADQYAMTTEAAEALVAEVSRPWTERASLQ
jgi:hypothetical protein